MFWVYLQFERNMLILIFYCDIWDEVILLKYFFSVGNLFN